MIWTFPHRTTEAAGTTQMVMKHPKRNTRKINVIIGIMIQNTETEKRRRKSTKKSQRKHTKRTEIDPLKGRIKAYSVYICGFKKGQKLTHYIQNTFKRENKKRIFCMCGF